MNMSVPNRLPFMPCGRQSAAAWKTCTYAIGFQVCASLSSISGMCITEQCMCSLTHPRAHGPRSGAAGVDGAAPMSVSVSQLSYLPCHPGTVGCRPHHIPRTQHAQPHGHPVRNVVQWCAAAAWCRGLEALLDLLFPVCVCVCVCIHLCKPVHCLVVIFSIYRQPCGCASGCSVAPVCCKLVSCRDALTAVRSHACRAMSCCTDARRPIL